MLAMLIASPAVAAPIQLDCKGETNRFDNRGPFSPTPETLSVSIDFARGTVTVGNQRGTWTVPMINRPNEDMVTLAHRDEGVTMGSINRITGVASFGFAAPGFSMFNGVCQRAQNLF
ncbi:MAG TPA: hypothetical protein VIY51_00300 [Xanthobacteraceae bacterium]